MPRRVAVSLGLGALVAGLGWQRRALTLDGAIAATGVGASTFGFGGWPASLGLIAFFVSGSALSRRKAVAGELVAARGHQRDAVQVFANGGFAALGVALSAAGCPSGRSMALGALAAAAADTWASEIGVRSPSPPRSILTGDPVRPGVSGGVTPLGWAAAGVGAALIGGVWALASRRRWGTVVAAIVAGLAGSLADSLAGDTVQASYVCVVCGDPSEAGGAHCGVQRLLVRGVPWITNDVVNVIATGVGALAGASLIRDP
ncbi:MAG: DUF92 domain-containing protein [Chloroflexi bacterium]|nr:DUF92 domain-containing protein [Chloroflexota bacterium]